MARAPIPGVSRRAEEASTAKRILVIQLAWTGETYRLAVNNVPLDHRMAVRKATGLPFTAFWGGENAIDIDSIAVLVWVARRLRGEPMLTWARFQRDWPDEITEGDIDVWAEDPAGHRVDEDGLIIEEDAEPEADTVDDAPES